MMLPSWWDEIERMCWVITMMGFVLAYAGGIPLFIIYVIKKLTEK